uniref:Psbb mrna maturation factor chloroplastic-like n=1 Tax=Tetraselmis sp. GSL018 TaxID=582737 RepID=A0A061RFL8_9CHLO
MAPAVGFRLANLKADCQFNPQLCSNHVGSNWKTCHAVTVPYLKFSRRNRFLSIKPYPICLQNELRRVGSFRASVNTGTKNCRTFEILASKKELDTQFRTNESSDTESEKPEVKVLRTFVEVSEESVETETAKQNTGSGVLKINLDLLLYRCRRLRHEAYYVRDKRERAKMYQQLEAGLKDAIRMDPKDGRAYVSLGKHYLQQKRFEDAYRTYEDGCAATEGQNPYIWQAWATLEAKRGNASHARKLYNAATVASESHVTAWHGWGQLEKQQGNYVRARELWIKGLQRAAKPNEYLYQSLGLLAEELGRIDEARMWFRQGTDRLKGVSAHAIWQAWALMEAKHGDPMTVRLLFRKGLKANPKSRYIYLSWGDWEKRMGNLDQARKILAKGNEVNPADPARGP